MELIIQENDFFYFCVLLSYHHSSYSFTLLCLYGEICLLESFINIKSRSHYEDLLEELWCKWPLLLKHITQKKEILAEEEKSSARTHAIDMRKSVNSLETLVTHSLRETPFPNREMALST